MAQYTVLVGENIYLLSNKLYGSLEYVFKLANDNNISDITADLAGFDLYYDESIKPSNSQPLELKPILSVNNKRTYTVGQKQSIFDIVNNTTGDIESVVSLCIDNGISDLSNVNDVTNITYNYTSNAFREWAIKNNKVFASGLYPSEYKYGSFDSGFDQQSYL